MSTSRRDFIKQSAGAVAVGLILPHALIREARAQTGRRIFVVIQLGGGNDGLNSLVPYTNSRYRQLRPTLHFEESELKDGQGNSTIISSEYALHPSLGEMKQLYDQGKVAIVRGVGYPTPSLSHFASMDIWHTANPSGGQGLGWLGKYADLKLAARSGFTSASVGGVPVKSLFADRVVIPNITSFDAYRFQTDPVHQSDRNSQLAAFNTSYRRSFPADSFLSAVTGTGAEAVRGAEELQTAITNYTSPVSYPSNPLANGMKMLAQIITTIPGADLLYVQMGGFDNHSSQIAVTEGQPNKLDGDHARLLGSFSEAVKAFYEDMAAHGLADNVVMMQWSEFGRRPNENASFGTDHGTASLMFLIGNRVKGGLYGEQPSLDALALDQAGNMRFNVDFRSVYAGILDRWLEVDSREVLGGQFEDLGFLT